MQNEIAQAAVLPFEVIDRLQVACGYERSFKISASGIEANRYLLGVNCNTLTRDQFDDICHSMGMPKTLFQQFDEQFDDANLVFLGFEANNQGGVYKIYLEFWDKVLENLKVATPGPPAQLLHRGFKWMIKDPARQVVTDYQFMPGLTIASMSGLINQSYQPLQASVCRHPVQQILSMTGSNPNDKRFKYVEVREAGNPRNSFDINFYPANLAVSDLTEPLHMVAHGLGVTGQSLQRVLHLAGDKPFGHLSSGLGRDGAEYLTIYYEC